MAIIKFDLGPTQKMITKELIEGFGILLVFDNKERTKRSDKWETHFEKIRNAYQKIDNVTVLGLKCI